MTECGALGLGAPPPLDEGVAVERKPAASVHHRHRPVHPDTRGHGALRQDHGQEVIMSYTGPHLGAADLCCMRASVLRVQSPELMEGDQEAEHVDDDPEGVGHVVPGRALDSDG